MSAASALGYLVVASFRGRLRQLVRRLRSPRHFFGILIGGAWLLFILSANRRPLGHFAELQGALEATPLVRLFAVGLLALFLLAAWVVVPEGNGLAFAEAEIHLLFAAPFTRRQLVAYKLAQAALGSLVSAVVMTAFFGRSGGAARSVMLALGLWLAMFTLSLHGAGASLTRAALAQHGARAVRRRLATLAIVAAVPVAAAIGWRSAPPLAAFPPGVDGLGEWSRALLGTAPLSWVVLPVNLLLGPALASGGGAFVAALPGALAVLAVHAAWVFSSDTAFEELAIRNAARLSARVDAVRSGVIPLARRAERRRSFSLRAEGRPETAVAWKGFVRATRSVSIPLLLVGLTFAATIVVALLAGRGERGGAAPLVAIVSLVFFAMSLVAGPQVFNGDLRRDAPSLELLRGLPLRGSRVLAGEIALPFLQTVAAQWALAALWLACAGGLFPGTPADHAAYAVAMAVGGPAICAVGFAVANGLVVVYPDWAGRSATSSSPLDRFGAQNAVGIVTALLSMIGIVPALLAGAIVGAAGWDALGPWAVAAGALAGAGAAAIEVAIALRVLGRAFERIDLSA